MFMNITYDFNNIKIMPVLVIIYDGERSYTIYEKTKSGNINCPTRAHMSSMNAPFNNELVKAARLCFYLPYIPFIYFESIFIFQVNELHYFPSIIIWIMTKSYWKTKRIKLSFII